MLADWVRLEKFQMQLQLVTPVDTAEIKTKVRKKERGEKTNKPITNHRIF